MASLGVSIPSVDLYSNAQEFYLYNNKQELLVFPGSGR